METGSRQLNTYGSFQERICEQHGVTTWIARKQCHKDQRSILSIFESQM